MKLSEIKGEKALALLADIIDPLTAILADDEIKAAANDRMKAIQIVLRKYPTEIIYILALLNQEDPETYQPSLLALPKMLIELTEDEEFKSVFTSAAVTAGFERSGDAQDVTQGEA